MKRGAAAPAAPTIEVPAEPIVEPDPAVAAADAPRRGRGRPRSKPAGSGRPPAPPRAVGRPTSIDKLAEQLADQFAGIGVLAMTVHPAVGQIIAEDAAKNARALAALAEVNQRVRRMLEGGVSSSAWLGVVFAFGGTAYKISVALKPAPAPAELDVDPAFADLAARFAASAENNGHGAG